MRRVLFDTNVVLDVLLDREPHVGASAAALDLAREGRLAGYLAGHAVTTIAYLVQRARGAAGARAVLADLLGVLTIAPVDDAVVRQALASSFADFEDGVTHAAALHAEIDLIVTRNLADFEPSALPVVTPATLRAG